MINDNVIKMYDQIFLLMINSKLLCAYRILCHRLEKFDFHREKLERKKSNNISNVNKDLSF